MLLEVKNLHTHYGNIKALHGVSFHVKEGEILSFIGQDEYHAANDIQGKTVFELPPESEVYRGTKEILEKFDIL